jgi:heavy-metal exporter, HME family
MFAFLIRQSLAQRTFVLCGTVVLIIMGMVEVQNVPVDVLPEIDRTTVSIITEGEGLAPEEVERRVTFPIETAMTGLKGVDRVRSISSSGLSIVFIDFALNTDIYRDRQLVAEKLALARQQLPATVTPEMGPISSVMGEILLIAATSDTGDMMALRDTADWFIRPRLMAIPGVSQVLVRGGDARQLRITPDPRRLDFYDVTIDQIEQALTSYNSNTGGDSVEQFGRRFTIMNVGRTRDGDDLLNEARNLVVTNHGGRPVLLNQVATVNFEARIKQGDAGFNGKQAVIIHVQKQPGVNTLGLTHDVEKALANLQPFLPKGIHADTPVFEQARFIETSVSNLKRVILEAAIVVTVILFAFLLNVRTTVVSLTAIPVSLLVTVLVFSFAGMTINTMTLGGLAIATGELVDDAVVGVENIYRRLRLNRRLASPRPALRVIADATVEVRSGIFYATLIVLLVFFPMFALPGIEGLMFTPLATTYIVSILASLVTSVTLTPVLAFYLLRNSNLMDHGDGRLVRFLKRQNERLLIWAFDHRATVIGSAAVAVAIAGIGVGNLPRAFLPPLNEGMYMVELAFRPGISLAQANKMGSAAERLMLEVPEVKTVGRRTGRAELDLHAEGVYQTEMDVELNPSKRSVAEILQDLRDHLSSLPGSIYIGQPLTHRINFAMSGLPSQLGVKIFGEDLDTLVKLGDELRGRLSHVPGLTDVKIETQFRIPQLRVQVRPDAARLYGITPAQLTRTLETLTAGRVVSEVIDENRRYEVIIRLDDRDRTNIGLRDLLIDTPLGRVPLHQLANVSDTDGPNEIIRDNSQRRIAVLANTDGSDLAGITRGIEDQVAAIKLPTGYYYGIEGTYKAQQAAAARMTILSLISLVLIFAVLYSRYNSAALSLIIMANVPLALIGSVVSLWIMGGSLSLATMIGFITLAGISTRNGILKISHYINLTLHEGEAFGRKMIIRGSLERMTPVLMTALSAGFGLFPLLLDAGDPGKEILSPVALVIFGGLISATLLDAVLTPILFLKFGERPLLHIRELAAAGQGSEAY